MAELDFLSASFDAAKALAAVGLQPPRPLVRPLNNISECRRFVVEAEGGGGGGGHVERGEGLGGDAEEGRARGGGRGGAAARGVAARGGGAAQGGAAARGGAGAGAGAGGGVQARGGAVQARGGAGAGAGAAAAAVQARAAAVQAQGGAGHARGGAGQARGGAVHALGGGEGRGTGEGAAAGVAAIAGATLGGHAAGENPVGATASAAGAAHAAAGQGAAAAVGPAREHGGARALSAAGPSPVPQSDGAVAGARRARDVLEAGDDAERADDRARDAKERAAAAVDLAVLGPAGYVTFIAEWSAGVAGTLSLLLRCFEARQRVCVLVRGAAGMRGVCTGFLLAFDRHFNLILQDVEEIFVALDYGPRSRWAVELAEAAKAGGRPALRRLDAAELKARMPWAEKTSTSGRRTIGLCRHVGQRYVRGDSVVLVQPIHAHAAPPAGLA